MINNYICIIKDLPNGKPTVQRIDIPEEFLDLVKVVENGAKKHGAGTWLEGTNPSLQHSSNHNSMFHHLADSYSKLEADKDSGLDPLLHLACRAMMAYTRKKRGIS